MRQGAVKRLEPKLVWLKMLDYPNPMLNMLSKKYNAILEQTLTTFDEGVLIKQLPMHRSSWDRNGHLTHDGQIAFWKHVSDKIQGLDPDNADGRRAHQPSDRRVLPPPFGMRCLPQQSRHRR